MENNMNIMSFGETVWDVFDSEESLGGAPFNFAALVSMLGESSCLVSAVGNDELGKKTVEVVKDFGVRTEYISLIPDKKTGKCLVTLDNNALPSYKLLDDVAFDFIQMPEIKEKVDVFSFGTLSLRSKHNKNVLSEILKLHSFAEIFCDVNIRPPCYSKESILFCLSNATIVKISEEEMNEIKNAVLGQSCCTENFVLEISERFTQLKLIILTKGADGALCYDCREKKFYYCEAYPTEVVSTVGAGDSFSASFLVSYLKNVDCQKCLEFASNISAYVCSKKEAVPKGIAELIKDDIVSYKNSNTQ